MSVSRTTKKSKLHPRNQHGQGYDFDHLIKALPELKPFILITERKQKSIDFSDNIAVKMLNKALLKAYYQIDFWDIPPNYLCPPIPGRLDYIHYLADLLADDNNGHIPRGKKIRALDIGTGANLVYPILAHKEYNWQITGSDIDPISVKVAKQISQYNGLKIDLKLQKDQKNIFKNIIKDKDLFTVTLCNPPFHSSLEHAYKGTERKWKNLNKLPNKSLNFGGQNAELWCEGGELAFIKNMILESNEFSEQCLWFTSLVSKKDNLAPLYKALKSLGVVEFKTINMAQGQKVSRFIAWTYIDKDQRSSWINGFT